MPKTRKYKYDRYFIELYLDIKITEEQLIWYALGEAERRARIQPTHASWRAELIKGSMNNFGNVIVKVIRKRLA